MADSYTISIIPEPHNQYTDENGKSQCSAFALAGIMSVFAKKYFGRDLRFSTSYIYGMYRRESNKYGKGMFEEEAVAGVSSGGSCLYEEYPCLDKAADAYDYVRAHPALTESAKKYAVMFGGYESLNCRTKAETFEKAKAALITYDLPIYASIDGHAVILCGYDGECYLYRDSDGIKSLKQIKYTKIKEVYRLIMASKFIDVPNNHWGKEAIEYCVNKGYLSGTGEGVFDPEKPMTRAQLCQVLMNYDKRRNRG